MGQMGRLTVWLNVMIVTDFLVKCGLETVHPPGSSRHPGTQVPWLPSVAIWLVGTEAAFSSQVFHHSGLLHRGLHDTVVLSQFSLAKSSPVTNYDTK